MRRISLLVTAVATMMALMMGAGIVPAVAEPPGPWNIVIVLPLGVLVK